MSALHEKNIHEQTLMPKDWLRRRMTRMVHKGQAAALRPSVTLVDISKWLGVDYSMVRHMEDGRIVISDSWQIKLSQFFYLLDMGLIGVRVVGREKHWIRTEPAEAPCKRPMPRVDFSATKLKFD